MEPLKKDINLISLFEETKEENIIQPQNKLPFKEKVMSGIEKRTIDRLVKAKDDTDDDFPMCLFEDYTEDEDENHSTTELAERIKKNTDVEEIDLGMISLVKMEVLKDLQAKAEEKVIVYNETNTVTPDEYIKIQMWSYFPIIGSLIYLVLLLALSFNRNGRYKESMQNWAKAQLKLYWIYIVVTLLVIVLMAFAGIALFDVFNRGLYFK